jgi:hypothetical protein
MGTILGSATVTGHAAGKQREGMKTLGLIDDKGKSTIFDKDGKFLLATLALRLNEARSRMKTPEFLLAQKQAFGIQGMAGASAISNPSMQAQIPQLRAEMEKMPQAKQFFKDMYENSPMQQARKTMADLTNILMDLAKIVLPDLSKLLMVIDKDLVAIHERMPHLPDIRGTGIPTDGMYPKPKGPVPPGTIFVDPNDTSKGWKDGKPVDLPSPFAAFGLWIEHVLGWDKGTPGKPATGSKGAMGLSPQLTPDEIADAIKKALNGMSINIDGRKAGSLIAGGMAKSGGSVSFAPSGFNPALSPVLP